MEQPPERALAGRAPSPWDPSARHRFVTSDGTALHVRDSGPVDAEVTLVQVHGWTQDNTCWDPVVERLTRGVRVLRYDHRGHGASAPAAVGTATIAQLADDLAELIADRASRGRLVLAGHSMGGMTIMALAERYPELVAERVSGAAFVATSSGEMDRLTLGLPGMAARGVTRGERVLQTLLEKRRKDVLPGDPKLLSPITRWLVFGKRARQRDVVDVTRQALRAHPASIAGFRESIRSHDRRVALCALRDIRTVVLAGERDRLCPVTHAQAIADQLPGTDYILYPGAGHMLTYERPREVADHLNDLIP
ncbi:alpha/beta fold hydrolase [Haloechinothrix sp. LS1_15]|nr:alpha/beta fold hydrolase [Haloechinothrix sp. LS1_15]